MVKIQTERQSCLPNLLHTKCKESEAGEHPKLHVTCLYCRTLNWVYKEVKKSAGVHNTTLHPHQTVSEPKTRARFLEANLASVGPVMEEGLMEPQFFLLGK